MNLSIIRFSTLEIVFFLTREMINHEFSEDESMDYQIAIPFACLLVRY